MNCATDYSQWYELPENNAFIKQGYDVFFSIFESMAPSDLLDVITGISIRFDARKFAFVMLDTQGEILVLHRIRRFGAISGLPPGPQDGPTVAMLNDIKDLSSYFVEFPTDAFHRTEPLDFIRTPTAIDDAVLLEPAANQIEPNPNALADEFEAVRGCRFIMLIPPCVVGQVLEAATTKGLSPRHLWIHIAQPIYNDESLRSACRPFIDWCRVAYAGGVGAANPLQMARPALLQLSPGLYQHRLDMLCQDLPVRFLQGSLMTAEVPTELGGVPWGTLPGEIWLMHIFPFVGPGNFRFLGSTCLLFRYIYTGLFTRHTMYDQVYTVGQARLCYQDLNDFYGHETGEVCGVKFPTQMETFCNIMACLGRQPVLVYLASEKCKFYPGTCAAAAEGGHFELLKWLHQQNCPWDVATCNRATRYKDCKMLKWLHEHGCPWDMSTSYIASCHGHWNILKFAQKNGCPMGEWICMVAAFKGNLPMLKWALSKGCPWDESTCSGAAGGGHLRILNWARSRGCPWNSSTCGSAASNGHLEVLQWAFENGCDLGPEVFTGAAQNGHLEVLKWLLSVNYPREPGAAIQAAEKGQFLVVQWLHSIDCIAWNEHLCTGAAKSGHLEMLQWLRSLGCPWDGNVCQYAVHFEKWEILRWAHENGCPWHKSICELAGKRGIGPMAVEKVVPCKYLFQNSL